jgi:hypothetical protein
MSELKLRPPKNPIYEIAGFAPLCDGGALRPSSQDKLKLRPPKNPIYETAGNAALKGGALIPQTPLTGDLGGPVLKP